MMGKQKYSLFHKEIRKDNLYLLLPEFVIKNHKVKRVESIKVLDVLGDEHLFSNDYIKYVDNKVAKNIDLLYRTKLFLSKNLLLTLYFSLVHTYLN